MIAKKPPVVSISADGAQRIAHGFAADQFGDLIGVGMPWRVISSLRSAWIVPLLLTSPGFGIVGIVGSVVIDEETGAINAWTTSEEVEANAVRLTQAKLTNLESAFQRAIASSAA